MAGFTPEQLRAVEARGDVLVLAGAGTGKTSTLVERCLRRVLDPQERLSLDEVLLVTFTEAAAGEMRRRIRQRLEEAVERDPGSVWLREQLALVDGAWISTLHSFCLRLVRDHFLELALDPEFTVVEEAQRAILMDDALSLVLDRHYGGSDADDRAVQELVRALGGASDLPVRTLVTRIHEFVCALAEPEAWLAREEARFGAADPAHWRDWLAAGVGAWAEEWAEELGHIGSENERAGQCRDVLAAFLAAVAQDDRGAALRRLVGLDGDWPPRKKTAWRKPLERLFEEAAFLASLLPAEGAVAGGPAGGGPVRADPLAEDWCLVRPAMLALLKLTREFGTAFADAKRELALVDFHDLEHSALRLLWDPAAGGPTDLARGLRRDLRYVFVDEYQDINAAQDRIVAALAREGSAANRFLVGDVKQSIYRFRLADPHIFQAYADTWGREGSGAEAVALTENFRSHEAILHFVNALFPGCMRREVGGVEYDPPAWLRFGDPANRRVLACRWSNREAGVAPGVDGSVGPVLEDPIAEGDTGEAGRVEVHLCVSGGTGSDGRGAGSGEEIEAGAEEEAALVAARLAGLRDSGFQVWSARHGAFRPAEWRDMVILLRSPRAKAEAYAKVFERTGIPFQAARRGLYDALEVSDLLSLLAILDNPLQDIPLLAVLRSPLVGLTPAELALIRLSQRSGEYWGALRVFHREPGDRDRLAEEMGPEVAALWDGARLKVDRFLSRHARWRTMARRVALSQCLETVLDETFYEAGLELEPRGSQRRANVGRLLALTRQFDRFQRQGLFRFLRFVEAQRAVDFDPEPAVTESQDAVRLMSIHQSKGLEFPVVVVADLAKGFNLDDTRGAVLLDENLGLCPMVRLARPARTYPSLPHWLAARRQRRETLGEEIRLLYVAATRACDKLILVGTVAPGRAEAGWPSPGSDRLTTRQIVEVRSSLDWLGRLLPQLTGDPDWLKRTEGQRGVLRWRRHDEPALLPGRPAALAPGSDDRLDPAVSAELGRRLAWAYPFEAATRESAKTSVTALRRRVAEETDGESRLLYAVAPADGPPSPGPAGRGVVTPADRGTAHHRFLESVDLDALARPAALRGEVKRLERAGLLSRSEASALDLDALAAFGRSELGQRAMAQRDWVRRELEFTLRLSPADFQTLGIPVTAGLMADEYVVVQGVVDLAVVLPDLIWIVDFKTDRVRRGEVSERAAHYAPQLRLYALALSRVYRRPVTEAWLFFLAAGCAEPVGLAGADARSIQGYFRFTS